MIETAGKLARTEISDTGLQASKRINLDIGVSQI
jgi:hypothetical protein